MKFAQIIEFSTSRIGDFNANLDAWIMGCSQGKPNPRH